MNFFLVTLIFLCNFCYLYAQEISITSQDLEVDIKKSKAFFTNQVEVRREGVIINAQKLIINYEKKELKDLLFTGGVKINNGKEKAYGEKAFYKINDSFLTIEGNAKIIHTDGVLAGDKFSYNFKTKRFRAFAKDSRDKVKTFVSFKDRPN